MTLTKIKGTSLLLDGYITRGNPIQRVYNGITYHIIHYQGEHANEFAIYETKNGIYDGRAELYKDGMLKIRWEMKNGKRDGKGSEMDLNGNVIRSGKWVNGIHESEIPQTLEPCKPQPIQSPVQYQCVYSPQPTLNKAQTHIQNLNLPQAQMAMQKVT